MGTAPSPVKLKARWTRPKAWPILAYYSWIFTDPEWTKTDPWDKSEYHPNNKIILVYDGKSELHFCRRLQFQGGTPQEVHMEPSLNLSSRSCSAQKPILSHDLFSPLLSLKCLWNWLFFLHFHFQFAIRPLTVLNINPQTRWKEDRIKAVSPVSSQQLDGTLTCSTTPTHSLHGEFSLERSEAALRQKDSARLRRFLRK